MMYNENVSVIVPAFNEEKHIGKCLDSLLRQTYKNLEIVVVDDGSTDDTREIVKRYEDKGVRLLLKDHSGPGVARNFGTKHANGKILVFVDADMEFDKRYIEELVKPIAEGKIAGTCHGSEKVTNKDNLIARCWGETKLSLTSGNVKVFRAIKKAKFLEVGGFDVGAGYYDDQSLSNKLGSYAEIVPSAICYHYNPETFFETYHQAKWIGKSYSLKKQGLFGVFLRIFRLSFPLIFMFPYYGLIYATLFLYPVMSRLVATKNLKFALIYSVFQLIEAAGWLVGYFTSLVRLSAAKIK